GLGVVGGSDVGDRVVGVSARLSTVDGDSLDPGGEVQQPPVGVLRIGRRRTAVVGGDVDVAEVVDLRWQAVAVVIRGDLGGSPSPGRQSGEVSFGARMDEVSVERRTRCGRALPAGVGDLLADDGAAFAVLGDRLQFEALEPVLVGVCAAFVVGHVHRWAGAVVGELVPVHTAVVGRLGVAHRPSGVVRFAGTGDYTAEATELVPSFLVVGSEFRCGVVPGGAIGIGVVGDHLVAGTETVGLDHASDDVFVEVVGLFG